MPRAVTTTGQAVASASFSLDATSLVATGLVYDGSTTVALPGGSPETILEFSMNAASITNLDVRLGCGSPRALETYTPPGRVVTSGVTVLDVLELKVASPAIDFTVASPPAPVGGVALGNPTLTGLTATVAYWRADSLSGPLLSRPVSC